MQNEYMQKYANAIDIAIMMKEIMKTDLIKF